MSSSICYMEKNSASASMNVGRDNYFDKENIFKQFEHLFRLLPFKKVHENLNFACRVDNAKTHA